MRISLNMSVRRINAGNTFLVNCSVFSIDLGFTGSAGTAVITIDKAALFTDGRYFNQASKQLDENWQLMKVGLLKVPTWQEWVADISQEGKTIGVDPAVITVGILLLYRSNVDGARELKKKLKNAGKGKLVGIDENLVDKVWGTSRPIRPEHSVFVLPERFTGSSLINCPDIQGNHFTRN
jgi:Xaa-Pro aminopeptidase